jgi:hypothetical protein
VFLGHKTNNFPQPEWFRCGLSGWTTRHVPAQASGGPRLIKVERLGSTAKAARG